MQHRYQPMHAPRKELTDEDLARTLAKHARSAPKPAGTVHVAPSGSGEPAPVALVWQKPVKTSSDGQGYQRSVCERFVIAKTKNMGEFVYTASRCQEPAAQVLGAFNTPELARAFCEKHR